MEISQVASGHTCCASSRLVMKRNSTCYHFVITSILPRLASLFSLSVPWGLHHLNQTSVLNSCFRLSFLEDIRLGQRRMDPTVTSPPPLTEPRYSDQQMSCPSSLRVEGIMAILATEPGSSGPHFWTYQPTISLTSKANRNLPKLSRDRSGIPTRIYLLYLSL